jgi:hypothetical protein
MEAEVTGKTLALLLVIKNALKVYVLHLASRHIVIKGNCATQHSTGKAGGVQSSQVRQLSNLHVPLRLGYFAPPSVLSKLKAADINAR